MKSTISFLIFFERTKLRILKKLNKNKNNINEDSQFDPEKLNLNKLTLKVLSRKRNKLNNNRDRKSNI